MMLVFCWLIIGLLMDIAVMTYIKCCANVDWDKCCLDKGISRDMAPVHTVLEIAKETPWWAHCLIIAFPPSGLLRIAM